MAEIPEPTEPHADVSTLELLVVEESHGRARNARGWFITTLVALVLAAGLVVSIVGWSRATSVADSRGKAVVTLTEAYQTLTNDNVVNGKVDRCQDQAFATWIDEAIIAGQAQQGVLVQFYNTCEATAGKTFRS